MRFYKIRCRIHRICRKWSCHHLARGLFNCKLEIELENPDTSLIEIIVEDYKSSTDALNNRSANPEKRVKYPGNET